MKNILICFGLQSVVFNALGDYSEELKDNVITLFKSVDFDSISFFKVNKTAKPLPPVKALKNTYYGGKILSDLIVNANACSDIKVLEFDAGSERSSIFEGIVNTSLVEPICVYMIGFDIEDLILESFYQLSYKPGIKLKLVSDACVGVDETSHIILDIISRNFGSEAVTSLRNLSDRSDDKVYDNLFVIDECVGKHLEDECFEDEFAEFFYNPEEPSSGLGYDLLSFLDDDDPILNIDYDKENFTDRELFDIYIKDTLPDDDLQVGCSKIMILDNNGEVIETKEPSITYYDYLDFNLKELGKGKGDDYVK